MAICGGCLYNDTDVNQDASHCQLPFQKIGEDPIQETYQGIVCRISSQQSGVRQPLEDNNLFSAGALLSRDASLPSDNAKYETAFDGQDPHCRLNETRSEVRAHCGQLLPDVDVRPQWRILHGTGYGGLLG